MMWKLIVGEVVTIEDLEEVDCMYVQSLRSIRDIHLSGVGEENFHEVIPLECFEGTSCTGKVGQFWVLGFFDLNFSRFCRLFTGGVAYR